ncbi:L-sorbosone dehydrogenase [Planctomycetales bacterium 10988]|nr:L-sorbosone dehydrogenase [Planctomycetales bacterium 10988]
MKYPRDCRWSMVAVCLLQGMFLSAALAQRDLEAIPSTDPQDAVDAFEIAPGWEVNLFADETMLNKPTQINFDEAGRLWIACSSTYPQIIPGEEAADQIVVVEDTDGDGKADKHTVFADKLLIPTGIVPDGLYAAYVANSTELLYFEDTDHDGKADRREVVLSGFGTEDTHHLIHTFRWGPIGRLYFNQSVYIHSHVETLYGVRRLNAGGVWQFEPNSQRLEVFARGMWNAWGHVFDDYGQSFATDGAGSEGIHFVFPGATFDATVNEGRRMYGLNTGHPKYCGLEVVGGSHLPEDWQGNLVTNDFRANRVCRFRLRPQGAGFAALQQEDLMRSSHVAFRPIDVQQGPDGAIYVADWYSPIIQHGEVDFRDPRRDKIRGRIWRLTYADRETVKNPNLPELSTADLVARLSSDEPWERKMAKRALVARPQEEVKSALQTAYEQLASIEQVTDRQKLELAWTAASQRLLTNAQIEELMACKDGRVRAAAVRLLGDRAGAEPDFVLQQLTSAVEDPFARVRLEAVRALALIERPQSLDVALNALDHPMDEFLDYALWLTCKQLAPLWLPEKSSESWEKPSTDPVHLEYALLAIAQPESVGPILALLDSGKVPAERQGKLLEMVAEVGNPEQLQRVFDRLIDSDDQEATKLLMAEALQTAAKQRKVKPQQKLENLKTFFGSDQPESLRGVAMQLAGVWKVKPLAESLEEVALDDSESLSIRQAAIEAIAQFKGQQAVKLFKELTKSETPAEVRQAALIAWTKMAPPQAGDAAVAYLQEVSLDEIDPYPLFQAFLQSQGGAFAIKQALEKAARQETPAISPDIAKVGLRAIQASGRPFEVVEQAIVKAGGLESLKKDWTPEAMQEIVRMVAESGDPQRGEAIYRRAELNCMQCHAIGGAGGKVGPDISGIGGSAQVDYLVESLVLPNSKIKENFHSVVVLTDEGQVLTGIQVQKDDEILTLRNAENKEIEIPLDSIDESMPGRSLMPEGLVDKLTEREITDLVAFLAALGKQEAFRVEPQPYVRSWQKLKADADAKFVLRRTRHATAAQDHPQMTWLSTFSKVDGSLPLEELGTLEPRRETPPTSFARFFFETQNPGKIDLTLEDPTGLLLYLDGYPLQPQGENVTLDCEPGVHQITVEINQAERSSDLRILFRDSAEQPAGAKLMPY